MTENNTQQAVKHFLLLLLFLGVLVFGFLYVAKGKIKAEREQFAAPGSQAPPQGTADEKGKESSYDGAFVNVIIGGATVRAEVAQSDAKKALGLGNREKLEKGTGMLFAFETPSAYRFWNRDMLIPIDIIWIFNDKVVDVYEHLPAYAAEKDFVATPKAPVNFVLEVPDGFIKEHAIRIGDAVGYGTDTNE